MNLNTVVSSYSNLLINIRLSCILLISVIILSSCSQNEFDYRRNGIGSDLYSADLKQATQNLETYFGFICQQAGINGNGNPPSCNYATMGNKSWTLFVQSGFNDIDRRCDGYLAWIEEVRNREAFGNSQINAIETLVRGLKVATGVASVESLAIIGEAFGYSQSLFTDYHRFLYNGLESSTIKAIVSERRLAYRISLRDVQIQYKPDAVNILRSYLRICMPFTITMDANTFARASATGNDLPNYVDPRLQRETLIGQRLLRDTPETSKEVIVKTIVKTETVEPKPFDTKFQTKVEETLDKSDVQNLQSRLCAPQTGRFDNATRAAILKVQGATNDPAPSNKINTSLQLSIIEDEPRGCEDSRFRFANLDEKLLFRGDTTQTRDVKIMRFQRSLFSCVNRTKSITSSQITVNTTQDAFTTGILDKLTRDAVRIVLPAIRANGADGSFISDNTQDAIEKCIVAG